MSHFVAPPRRAGQSAAQEKGDVRAKTGGQRMPFRGAEIDTEESFHAHEEPGAVAASAPETGAGRDPLRETRPHARAAREEASFLEEGEGTLDHVRARPGYGSPANLQRKTGRPRRQDELVLERHGLEERIHFVIAVGAAAQNPESQIHLRRTAHADRGGSGASRRPATRSDGAQVLRSGHARTRRTARHQSSTFTSVARSVSRCSDGFPPFSSAYMRYRYRKMP